MENKLTKATYSRFLGNQESLPYNKRQRDLELAINFII